MARGAGVLRRIDPVIDKEILKIQIEYNVSYPVATKIYIKNLKKVATEGDLFGL